MNAPVYVDPFLGAGAVWLHLLHPSLTPPVSWMGGKRRMAPRLLGLLGLHPGQQVPAVLGDASWWGWVWSLCLDPVPGPVVCAWLRSWRQEDPRALWFRLRDEGAPADPVERAAGLLWLQARAASGVPVWWEGDPGGWWYSNPALVQWASTKVDGAGQRQATDPRLVQDRGFGATRRMWPAKQKQASDPRLLASDGRGVPREAGHKAEKSGADNRTGGMIDPGTIADRLDAIRVAAAPRSHLGLQWRQDQYGPAALHPTCRLERRVLRIEHRDALEQAEEWAPILGDRARVYLDPPYRGATGYPATCPRERVLLIAETCARHGGRVVLSEAEGLAADLGTGWQQCQIVRGRKPEWVTTYGCHLDAVHGPLFHRAPSEAAC